MQVSELTQSEVTKALKSSLAALGEIESAEELKQAKSQLIGDAAPLTKLNSLIKGLPNEQKADAGKMMGAARAELAAAFEAKEAQLEKASRAQRLKAEKVDLTASPAYLQQGARHPLSLLMDQISDVFVGMGWEIADGPELENEWFNFDALNFHPDHPARAMQDTFFVAPVENHLLLRTHTSPVQVRSLLERELPVYVLCPGRVFRTDELDAAHTPVFHQVEGLAVEIPE